jgi:ABC-type glycerol-3-phosphate transport system substrate-binding protein
MKDIGIKNIITGVFVLAAIIAFMVFSGVVKLGTNDQDVSGSVTVWGTIPFQTIQRYIDQAKEQNLSITYTNKNPDNYEDELVNAFASGSGPDLFIMPHEGLLRHSDKVLEIPYASFPRSSYEQTYIDEARIFLTDSGVIAFPITVDPMVMYYNKSLISSAFVLDVPEYWDEFIEFAPKLTKFSETGEVQISATALGTYENVRHAKSIISAMILQNQNQIIGTNPVTKKKQSLLSIDEGSLQKTLQALDFYTSFSNFGTSTYSWNEALPDSRSKFIAGELAIYFAPGSEAEDLRKKNPNLDFGVALFPQVRTNALRTTFGSMTGVAIAKQSSNIPASIAVASKLAGSVIADGLAKDLAVAPARKELLRDKPDDALRTLVYNSAIISRGWIDADRSATDIIFAKLIRSINTGALSTRDAIARTHAELNTMLDKTINTSIRTQ